MKQIDKNHIIDYKNNSALFFTSEGVLFEHEKQDPFIPIYKIHDMFDVLDIFYFEDHIIIYGKLILDNADFEIITMRNALTRIEEKFRTLFLKMIHWFTWNNEVNYCRSCGNNLENIFEKFEKKCTRCNKSCFPNMAPCITVLIRKNNEILLARSYHFKPGLYAAIAGFIDIGETAEEAVHREVFEEVGIKVKNLRYYSTQSWPFPGSFMVAFFADYDSGEIKIDNKEIEDAQWFSVDNLPEISPNVSIVGSMIRYMIEVIKNN